MGKTIHECVMEDMEKRAKVFALQEIDEALLVIETSYTQYEGVQKSYIDCLLGLEKIDELSLAARLLIVELLAELASCQVAAGGRSPGFRVASLSNSEVEQFVADLRRLRQRLDGLPGVPGVPSLAAVS